ncbi:restriction endonuclease subunit S [Blautia sp. XA-2221]|uniref:restriction endonuclease subunit S n=1 Tax=Blautia sp. XA-2221 TaxID=2903961 RepID=UPI00237858FE|nr:restriction endonuclease subunit S [Blautia sp. XA-2221]
MERYKLGDICEIVSGSTPKTSIEEYWDGDVKWITPAELDNDSYIITDTVRKITELAVKKSGLSSFPEGTVILSSRAPIGKVAIAGCEMYCNQGFKNLICSEKINNKYLYWFLKGNTEFLNSLGRGATFKEISKQIVANIEINVPDYERQMNIVKHLEKINKIIKLRRQELEKWDDLTRARFIELFGHQSHNEKNMPYGKINDVAEIYLGLTHTPTYVEDGVKFISAKNTSCDYLDLSDVKYISREEFEKAPKGTKPLMGDVLFSRVGSNLGHPVILDVDEELCTFVSLGFLRAKGQVTNVYLKHWMRDGFFAEQVAQKVVGGGQPNLNTGWLKEFKIIIPPMALQNEFAAFVAQTDKSKFL